MSLIYKSDSLEIRSWRIDDFPVVRNILLSTWKDTYKFIPEKDIIFHLDKYYNLRKLNNMLIDKDVKGILAVAENKPAGFMKLFNDRKNNRFYISSLYVLPGYQGFGIGKSLLNAAEESAKDLGYDRVWLGVMKQNKRSVEWYERLAFIFIEEEPFQMGSTTVRHLIGYKQISQ